MSDRVGNQNVGFLVTRLNYSTESVEATSMQTFCRDNKKGENTHEKIKLKANCEYFADTSCKTPV